ncbi:MAG: hypothetical protein CM1200mP39_07370 [Dehalococcoidia bacterium]|nr:MAG: hypothetical protein CM1200mP39_07370 [Dehalococcoidia bacterium]
MHPFAYVAPSTVEEAVAVLDEHGDRARPLAGGTDLLVKPPPQRLGVRRCGRRQKHSRAYES